YIPELTIPNTCTFLKTSHASSPSFPPAPAVTTPFKISNIPHIALCTFPTSPPPPASPFPPITLTLPPFPPLTSTTPKSTALIPSAHLTTPSNFSPHPGIKDNISFLLRNIFALPSQARKRLSINHGLTLESKKPSRNNGASSVTEVWNFPMRVR
ncbi:hypothetical protein BGX38DRAFT_1211472, partial [Terfezia claveryi]